MSRNEENTEQCCEYEVRRSEGLDRETGLLLATSQAAGAGTADISVLNNNYIYISRYIFISLVYFDHLHQERVIGLSVQLSNIL